MTSSKTLGLALGLLFIQAPAWAQAPIAPPAQALQALPDFSALVSQVSPAVVSITARQNAGEQMQQNIPFGMFHMARESQGSGFLISADGLIITNGHVVDNAQMVSITLNDGTILPAHVVGIDHRTDLAVLRVKADHPLPFIALGDSSQARPGQWVVAVGNPFGLGETVTAGIVSALGRDIGAGPYDNFLQVDAPINRGNSGGPLFNQKGQVIGVTTAILSPSGGSVGIGFAIPSNLVSSIVSQIEKTGHVTRGYLGVESQMLTPSLAAAMRLGSIHGALVTSVRPGSPAAAAHLQEGDLITKVQDNPIASPRELARQIADVPPNTSVSIEVLRQGDTKTLTAKIATLETESNATPSEEEPSTELGLEFSPLTPESRAQARLPDATSGILIDKVEPGSKADQAGIATGDILVRLNGHAVTSPSDVNAALSEATGQVKDHPEVAMQLWHAGHTVFVPVRITPDDEPETRQP